MATKAAPRSYPLDNDHDHSGEHHAGLATVLDPVTTARLSELGDWTGARCLEVGAGAGSVALWLAERVGPTGDVLAVDLKPGRIPEHPRLRVQRHDLLGEQSLPAGPYDLIHARLVLGHLPPRERILGRLAGLLAPGGTVLIEDWAGLRTDMVAAAPSDEAARLYDSFHTLVGTHLFDANGTDPTWARRIHRTLLQEGLVDVQTSVHARFWTGGGPGTRMIASIARQFRPKLLALGLTPGELDELAKLLEDPRLVLHGHPLYSSSGRRPVIED